MPRLREAITGYVGPMFAKKTLLMLHDVSAAEATGRDTLLFKPDIDTRYKSDVVRSRAGGYHPAIAIPVNQPETVFLYTDRHQQSRRLHLVAFDEIQFFDPSVSGVVLALAEEGISVVYCGLNRDYRGNPFPTMQQVMPLASDLQVVEAKCMYSHNGDKLTCGADAEMTQRLINGQPDSYNSPTVIIEKNGTEVTYQARCLEHWQVANMPSRRQTLTASL